MTPSRRARPSKPPTLRTVTHRYIPFHQDETPSKPPTLRTLTCRYIPFHQDETEDSPIKITDFGLSKIFADDLAGAQPATAVNSISRPRQKAVWQLVVWHCAQCAWAFEEGHTSAGEVVLKT